MENSGQDKGLRILSLGMYHLDLITQESCITFRLTDHSEDGGGPGCFSQLVILDEYMSRIAHEKQTSKSDQHPADHFDLIGGVGFGAYVVFLTNINNHK
jgi:hypothetical protein